MSLGLCLVLIPSSLTLAALTLWLAIDPWQWSQLMDQTLSSFFFTQIFVSVETKTKTTKKQRPPNTGPGTHVRPCKLFSSLE